MGRLLALVVGLLLAAPLARGAPAPEVACEAGQNAIAGRYAACRQATWARAVRKGLWLDFSKCNLAFAAAWQKLEARTALRDAECPSQDEAGAVLELIASQTAAVAEALSGEGVPRCGDRKVNAVGEECDGSDLRGKACSAFGWPAGTLACDDACQFDVGACLP
jgi:hypothetical protein